ncbi:MAG: tetratricopeptide repeat protein [Candidatus Paceibacterota bacterium]
MQNNKSYNLIIAVIGVLIILAIGAYLYTRTNTAPAVIEGASSTPITTNNNGVVTTGGSSTVTDVTPQKLVAPNYRTPLAFSASISSEVRAALNKQFDATVAIIAKDSINFQAWNNLGIVRKMAGDYKGAETAWKYVAALYPSSTIPFDNLGGLYLDFLKDYPKAEANFKVAIKNNAQDINAYEQLFALYTTYGYKAGTSAAADLIAQGLKANPDNQTLLQYQSQLNSR